MKREDDLADADARAYHELLHGRRGVMPDDDMGDFSNNLVLGDLNVTPKPSGMSKFAKAVLLGASLLGTGGLGGLSAWLLTRSTETVTQPGPDTNNRYDIGTEPGGNW